MQKMQKGSVVMSGLPEWRNWLARDKDEELLVFENEPTKDDQRGWWTIEGGVSKLVEETDDTYAHIKWTDEEPTLVKTISAENLLTEPITNKAYKVNTQEEYTALMERLENDGYKWSGGKLPTKKNYFSKTAIHKYIFAWEDKTLKMVTEKWLEEQYPGLKPIRPTLPETETVTDKPITLELDGTEIRFDKSKSDKNNLIENEEERLEDLFDHEMTIKPDHYRTNQGKYADLFDKWYHENELHVFRAIMRATAERYITRYENKNGVIDLEKGIYTLTRLKEYEELESEEE